MTISNDFTGQKVMESIARELRRESGDLEVVWDETQSPMIRCWVKVKSIKASFVVHRSEEDVVADSVSLIEENLLDGTLFKESLVNTQVLDAIAGKCNLADLSPYLAVESKEGWLLPSEGGVKHVDEMGEAKTIGDLKLHQAKLLEGWLKEPVKSVWRLQGGDLAATAAVLLEQCSFDTKSMCQTILDVLGGWREFGICPVVGKTPEGYIIEAENNEAGD